MSRTDHTVKPGVLTAVSLTLSASRFPSYLSRFTLGLNGTDSSDRKAEGITLLPYALIFFASLLVDCIPIFAPPAWTVMLLIMIKFELNPWIVVTIGTLGTVCGRIIYSTYIVPWIGKRSLGESKQTDLDFVGKRLSSRPKTVFFFVFAYAVLPLSTTALFTAVGLSKVRLIYVVPAFFLGNLIGDGILLIAGGYAIHNFSDLYKGALDPKSLLLIAVGLVVMLLMLFIDWRSLLEKNKLVLKWQFWK
ncbi:hypothetical protein BH10BDE1_BH10BDE1_09280 [soil metagenome]